MQIITKEQIEKLLPYNQLISALQKGFQEEIVVPLRHHHTYQNPSKADSILLLMPAWKVGEYVGVKIITVSPDNGAIQLPSVQGVYLLFHAINGIPLAQMEAKTLTNRRTAAASALASTFLSRKDSHSLLMVGTGNMAPALIEAHATIRPIDQVFVWGRNVDKAKTIVQQFQNHPFTIQAVEDLEKYARQVDIISCATLSNDPLIKGSWLQAGQHLDLVGSFTPTMRETDNEAIMKSAVYVDIIEGATKESGDIVIPMEQGILDIAAIQGDLFSLCKGEATGRQSDESITLFKSVGHALEDLVAAKMVYEGLNSNLS